MAYLSPKTLTCPECQFEARIEIVVGVGPSSRKGDVPQRYFRGAGPFVEGRADDGVVSLFCPHDGALVWRNIPSAPAYGPLTPKEMQTLTGERWLAPGTENPFPRATPPFDPGNPFSGRAPRRKAASNED